MTGAVVSTPQAVDVVLAGAGGEYMDSAVVLEWKAALGDSVTVGETLVVVETAKAATEIDSPVSGVLTHIAAEAGSEVMVGALLGRIEPAGPAHTSAQGGSASPSGAPGGAVLETVPSSAELVGLPRRWPRAYATPLAKRLAVEHGIDLSKVAGSGPHHRIVKADVLAAAHTTQDKPKAEPELSPRADGYRRAMAQHMARAAGIPSFSIAMDCDGTSLLARRAQIKTVGGRASVNDLILHAVAQTLKRHRRVNARWDSEGVAFNEAVHLGIAVATDLGLVVPVVRHADRLSLEEVAAEVTRLRLKAESQSLTTPEIVDGTFTVSNLGPLGVASFTATLNPPQAAILAVPAFKRVVFFDDGRLESRPVARLSLTADHRVLDGIDAARFLADLCRQLEKANP